MTTLFYSPVDDARITALAKEGTPTKEAYDLLFAARDEGLFAAVYADRLSLRLAEDGRYAFTYPVPLYAGGGASDAFFDRLDAYLLAEELPYVFCEVPRSALSFFCARYRRTEKVPLDEDGRYFLVRAVTEIEELESIPVLHGTSVTLTALTAEDIPSYAALCRDDGTLRYYGYDVRADVAPCPDDAYFFGATMREWDARRTLPFAVRAAGKFVGEILLYGFDAHGGASVAVRLLPAARKKGYARDALAALLCYAEKALALLTVRAEVRKENLPSLRLFGHVMQNDGASDGSVFYRYP